MSQPATVVASLVERLAELGVSQAFGVSGGAIARLFEALEESSGIALRHFRQDAGAAFAATEAYFASGRPTVVFATTGPGSLNVLTGIASAHWDGAKVVLLSGMASSQRGRWAAQETSPYNLSQRALAAAGQLFDFAVRVENGSELPEVVRRLGLGLRRPGRFVAHVCLPMAVQGQRVEVPARRPEGVAPVRTPQAADVVECVRRLRGGTFAVWAGFGATASADALVRLVERSGARVFCSPRAKGVVPEDHPSYLGVTGIGGHPAVREHMARERPDWVLVLGTRLSETTSLGDEAMIPAKGFIHVDLDPSVLGSAYPEVETLAVRADVGAFLGALLERFPEENGEDAPRPTPATRTAAVDAVAGRTPIRPQVLMTSLQRHVVEGSDAVVLAECGNPFAWANHHLRFPCPGRYRASTLLGASGHTAAGVVGAALGRDGKAVAIVSPGAMLMNAEVSTAVQYGAQAVWVVLNTGGGADRPSVLAPTKVPAVDFAAMARSMGANGLRIEHENQVESALMAAMTAKGPFVVDVLADSAEVSPLWQRFEELLCSTA